MTQIRTSRGLETLAREKPTRQVGFVPTTGPTLTGFRQGKVWKKQEGVSHRRFLSGGVVADSLSDPRPLLSSSTADVFFLPPANSQKDHMTISAGGHVVADTPPSFSPRETGYRTQNCREQISLSPKLSRVLDCQIYTCNERQRN